jgi:DNA repair exonuclease SbcCD nuclease subunit
MAKIVCLTDSHFGGRGDSEAFDKFFQKFYDNVFFPTIDERKIDTIIHLGDCFDRRKYINFNSLRSCREYFFDAAKRSNVKVHMLVGNHDAFFKNTNDVNSPQLLLKEYDNVITYHGPSEPNIKGLSILMLPWICTDNYQQSMEAIKNSTAKVCFGHLELSGFTMFKGQEAHDGLDPSIFKNFDLVCSGHFHHRHSKGNIHYLGNPYQMFWNDYADPRGFHIFDTETLELEFIENPYVIFEKLYYDDAKDLPSPKEFTDMMVKVIVVNKSDHAAYENYMDKLYKANPLEVKIIEDFSEFEAEVMDDETIDLSDTQTLVAQYIDALDTDVDKTRLKTIMKTLYIEAQDYNT